MRPYDFCGKENNESATKLKQGLVGKITVTEIVCPQFLKAVNPLFVNQ
jgi:hypothetical protein